MEECQINGKHNYLEGAPSLFFCFTNWDGFYIDFASILTEALQKWFFAEIDFEGNLTQTYSIVNSRFALSDNFLNILEK